LRAENRRLRAQLELAKAMQGAQSNTSGPRVQPDAGAIPLPDRLSATTNQNATSLSG